MSCHKGEVTIVPDLARIQKGRSRAVSSAAPTPGSNADRIKYITPGETRVLADIKGPGIINHIWLTFNEARPNWLEKGGSANPGEIVLRMYWDSSETPAVESPLGDFFAAGFGLRREIQSVPIMVEGGDGYNCYWPMPFYKRALISITNEGDKNIRSFYYQIDYLQLDHLPPQTAYFCAQYKQEFPEETGSDYLILDAEGKGHYVGTVMSVRTRSPYWFGEGDAKFYIDGEEIPSIWGTGTEDYFLCAWGLNECLYPYFGCTFMSGGFGDLGTRYTLYRWHITDPVRFTRSLRFEIEHKGWISADETVSGKVDGHVEREDDIATVAYWYQLGQPKQYTSLPSYQERVLPNLDIIYEGKDLIKHLKHSKGRVRLQAGYDWTGDGQVFFQPTTDRPFMETTFFVEKEEYRGLILKMTHSYDYGIYRIFLDGKKISQLGEEPNLSLERIDFYSSQIEVKDYYLGSFTLSKGYHQLRFESVGQNSLSKGSYLGFDSIRLRERWQKKRESLR
jgi:hypothetical protein